MTKTASEMTVAELVAELKRRNEHFPVGDNFLLDLANRLADEPKADPNPLDPTNHHFRLCLNGHVPYSISFDGCPSCKAVAMNAAQQLNRPCDP